MPNDKSQSPPVIDSGAAVDRDVIDIAQRRADFAQAEVDRLGGESGPMLDSAKALLFRRGHEGAVFHDARGGVGVVGVKAEDEHGDKLKGKVEV